MDIKAIKKLITQGESANLEFKKSTGQLEAVSEAICAFLNTNTNGGVVLIGVADSGNIIGQAVSDNTHKEIAQYIRRIEPAVHVKCDFIKTDKTDKYIIVLQASPSVGERPYPYKGKYYQRVGATTSLLPQNRVKQILLESMQVGQYESLPAKDNNLSTIDESLVKKIVSQGVEANRCTRRVERPE